MRNIILLWSVFSAILMVGQCPPQLSYYTSTTTQTLTCFDPTIVATATTSTPNTQITWLVPATPSVVNSSSIILGPPTGPPTSTTATFYSTYTIVATNTAAACSTQTIINVYQNFKIPTPLLSVGNPSVIDCSGNAVILSLTNNAANSGIPGAIGMIQSWYGPAPQGTSTATSYNAFVAGSYSLVVQDSKNGCVGSVTKNISANNQPPIVLTTNQTCTLDCGPNQVAIPISVTSPSSGVSFFYFNYPNVPGVSFSPPGAVLLPNGTSSPSVIVNKPGFYQCRVKDNNSQCTTTVNTTIVLNDILSQVGILPTPPSCSTCCDGTVTFSVPAALANNFSVSVSSGTINGNPPTSLSNLCYGSLYYTLYNTQNNCNLDGYMVIDGTVGISEKSAQENIVIYPNPSNGIFTLKNLIDSKAHISITTIDGQLITNANIAEANDLSYLPSGIYMLTIKTINQVFRKKLIINR